MLSIFCLLFGLCIGSFLNCLAYRLYTNETIGGRSHCPNCKKPIRWYDNIPVISFLILGGHCRDCKKKISWNYPATELVTGLLFTFSFWLLIVKQGTVEAWLWQDWLMLVRDWILVASLIVVFITDSRWYLIFFEVTVPAAVITGIINLLLGMPWQRMLLATAVGGGFFLLQYIVSKGKWIGEGDIWLGLLMGAGLGWPLIVPALFGAYLIGSMFGIALLAIGRKRWGGELPFGTFLAVSAVIALFYGHQLIDWYLNLAGLP